MKKTKMTITICVLGVLALILGACKPAVEEPVFTEEELQKQVLATQSARATQFAVETMAAQLTALSMPTNTPVPTEVPTQAPPQPTQEAPTAVVGEPTATAVSQPVEPPSEKQCYAMELISETLPSGTTMEPGEKFEKSWTIRNSGTCTWSPDFDLKLSGGEAFGSNKLGDVKEEVGPGDTTVVTLSGLVAPRTEGTYYSFWVMSSVAGDQFGYGPNGSWGLNITIQVKKP
ncbi:MAG: hypothetical protein GX853_00685 [Chloroflexi bacterium]|nr:hypothetical protein [Chloroflexota bacterium]